MLVVTLPKSARNNPLAFAKKAARSGADILEIRGDLTPGIKNFRSPLPVLLSPRGVSANLIDQFKPEYLDLELGEKIPGGSIGRKTRVIRSFHDYRKTPTLSELKSIEKKLRIQNPWAVKIAVNIRSYADLRILEKFRGSIRGKRSIVLGMGPRAHLNRMLSPLLDALTYTYLNDGEQAAEGQIPIALYRLVKHCKKPRLFGLLGSLDIRSLSPLIHNTLFKRHGIDALYFLALTDDLDDAWKNLTALGVDGFSVTSPWKRTIVGKLDRVGENSRGTISVNTVVKKHGSWIGYARDAEGLLQGYSFLRSAKSAGILGSGGVVSEVVRALRLAGVGDIRIFARNAVARLELAGSLGVGHGSLGEAAKVQPDVFICAINADIDLPLAVARNGAHAIDLRYGRKTKFLLAAKKSGYMVHDGLPMLLNQALAQFALFTGRKTSIKDVNYLKKILLTANR
jgi:shikimate dehydrogenase